jgi:hypothetical protein
MKYITFFFILISFTNCKSQEIPFPYTIQITPVDVPGFPGLHSYACAQHNGKWLIIGGRTDGLHERQPFRSFPQSKNNDVLYVVDVNAGKYWSASINTLSDGLRDQLQSSNMNFYQDGDVLYLIGGYAYAVSLDRHITFPNLTAVHVSSLIDAVINAKSINSYFYQITDDVFAVTGGQLGKIGNTFYLTGGHRFDGRYNPMGHASYQQTYTNQIRMFHVNLTGNQLAFSGYKTHTDSLHLRRRDFNLLPQIFPDGSEGYMISSGVFQEDQDLPFLYPVDIMDKGYKPITTFNQYLSNYHSAKVSLYDKKSSRMHMLFFGGMSQHYYQDGTLIKDDNVPFVKTISLVTRFTDGTRKEYNLPVEMPAYAGASAEFILNHNMPHSASDIIMLNEINQREILIGHIAGGIESNTMNPFSMNQSSTTKASTTIYAVKLIRK